MRSEDLQLLEQYLDGTLVEGDIPRLEKLLLEDSEARATLRTLATLDLGLHDLAAGQSLRDATTSIETRSIPPGRTTSSSVSASWTRSLLAIATLAIIGLGTALWFQTSGSPVETAIERNIAKVTGTGGEVAWTGNGGSVTTDLKRGSMLTGGTIEGTGPTSWVELEFLDGSRVTVAGDSRLTFSDLGQKVLHLKEGSVTSSVKPQQSDSPMLVYTRNAMLEVLGTEFEVDSDMDTTSLDVTEGKVRFKRLSDGQTVDVPANQRVRAASGVELSPQPIPTVANQWKSKLELPYNLFGKWTPKSETAPPRLKQVPHQHTTPDGEKIMTQTCGVFISGGDSETVMLHADSKIRVRGIARLSQQAVFGVSARGAGGGFGGVFMTFEPGAVFWKKLSDFNTMKSGDELTEFEVVLNAGEFLLSPELEREQQFKDNPVDSIVDAFFCLSPFEESRMEIIEVEIFRTESK